MEETHSKASNRKMKILEQVEMLIFLTCTLHIIYKYSVIMPGLIINEIIVLKTNYNCFKIPFVISSYLCISYKYSQCIFSF